MGNVVGSNGRLLLQVAMVNLGQNNEKRQHKTNYIWSGVQVDFLQVEGTYNEEASKLGSINDIAMAMVCG